jgi:hypothetical protein
LPLKDFLSDGLLSSFGPYANTRGIPGTVDEKGKPLEKQKIAVS